MHDLQRSALRDDGSAMVEFALTSTILFMTIFGILSFSLVIFAHHQVSEAARQGSRYAMVHGNTCSVNGTSCTATASEIQTYVRSLSLPAVDASTLTVTTSYSSYPPGSTCTPNANCENAGNLVTVVVTYSSPINIPFVPSSILNMSGSSSMVISQ
jgi:Flp pilus assembly protein TadG